MGHTPYLTFLWALGIGVLVLRALWGVVTRTPILHRWWWTVGVLAPLVLILAANGIAHADVQQSAGGARSIPASPPPAP